jgi:hypothetical protein
MGIESAVYWFTPGSGGSTRSRETLAALGADVVDEAHLILRGPQHWIDVQVDVPPPTIALRIAFSNPIEVLDALRRTLGALEDADPGEVVDVATRERYRSVDDSTWASIVDSFEVWRREFQGHFGDFTAAISADNVFDHIHRQRTHD